jgi:hypothetical protein
VDFGGRAGEVNRVGWSAARAPSIRAQGRVERANMKRVILVVVAALIALHGSGPVSAQSGSFHFFKNYFVTGDYVVGGVGLRGSGGAPQTIVVNGVPASADVLGMFLYWQTVVSTSALASASDGATFEGQEIGGISDAEGTNVKLVNTGGTSPCWSAGGATGASSGSKVLAIFRADVLRFVDDINPVTGKLAINSADRIAAGIPSGGFSISVPDGGTGGSLPLAQGASLVVVYRDATATTPLKSIVIYNGGFSLNNANDSFSLGLAGFYQPATTGATARLTPIVADGQANFTENVALSARDGNGVNLSTTTFNSVFAGAQGADWDNPLLSMAMPAAARSMTFNVTGTGQGSYDCLSFGAAVLSTEVQDSDADGLLDAWELPQTTPLVDPSGVALPNLNAMGAKWNAKDVFFEVGFMATGGYVGGQGVVPAHSHLPSKAAVDMVGDALKNAPITNLDGSTGIRAHIDVGNNYQGDPYVIPFSNGPNNLARGGEMIAEQFCVPDAAAGVTCDFPDYAGVVGWKSGYQFLRDAVLNPAAPVAQHQNRFDQNRLHSFRYVLFAHALGLESSVEGVPTKTSGIGDPPGGDAMVTLGFWDNFVGTDFMQASTWLHEFGHTGNLKHGGPVTVAANGATSFEPNCRPNHLSVMSYLFQTRGLICDATSTVPSCAGRTGLPVIDFSRQVVGALDENSLSEPAGLGALPYRTRWYSPTSFIDTALLTTPPTKHCDGSPLATGEVGLFRIDGTSATGGIDWNGDGTVAGTVMGQDVTFSGPVPGLAEGDPDVPYQALNPSANDWLGLDLRHVGSRRNVGGLSLGVTMNDLGKGDLGKGDLGDLGKGDLGKGDLGKGDLGKGDLGKGDLGKGDLGKGDLGSPDSPPGDLDLDTARHIGNAPALMAPTVQKQSISLFWTPPHVDRPAILQYDIFRVIGTAVTPANLSTLPLASVPPTAAAIQTYVDFTVKNNTTYTYFVRAVFDGPQIGKTGNVNSGISNFQTVVKK